MKVYNDNDWLALHTRRAKNLRLPTASSRQYVASSSAFPSSHHLLPRRTARAIESDADDVPEKPLASTSSHTNKTSLITRPQITARRRWPEKSPSRSEYAPSVTRQASPVRSVASLMDRRSRSPAKGASSVASGENEGGKLWMALKEVNLSRQNKGSWRFWHARSLNYYLIYGFIVVPSTTNVLFLFMQSMISCINLDVTRYSFFSCAKLRIAIILPSNPVRDNEVEGSGYKEQDKVLVECVLRKDIQDLSKKVRKETTTLARWTYKETSQRKKGTEHDGIGGYRKEEDGWNDDDLSSKHLVARPWE